MKGGTCKPFCAKGCKGENSGDLGRSSEDNDGRRGGVWHYALWGSNGGRNLEEQHSRFCKMTPIDHARVSRGGLINSLERTGDSYQAQQIETEGKK